MPLVLNGTTGVSGVDGSAGTPALRGTDADSGVYFTGSQVGFSTNGAGTTMTMDSSGNVTFPGTVVMSSPFAMRNKIINGAMEIDQKNAGAATTNVNGHFIDRWSSNFSGAGRMTGQRSTTAPAGFINSASLTVTTTSTPSAGDYYNLYQGIEGLNISDLGWGTASAKTITVSFWVRNSVTGLYAIRLCNSGATRSYVSTYTVNAANTWEYKKITIPGDTTGTWLTDTNGGVFLAFDLGHGTNFDTTSPNTWLAGNYTRTAACVNFITNTGATFYVTGVQFEVGTAATPFERRLYNQELLMCQRYLIVTDGYAVVAGIADSSSTIWMHMQFPVFTRGVPSFSASGQLIASDDYAADYTASSTSITNGNVGTTGARLRFAGFSGLTLGRFYGGIGGSGKIIGSAEL